MMNIPTSDRPGEIFEATRDAYERGLKAGKREGFKAGMLAAAKECREHEEAFFDEGDNGMAVVAAMCAHSIDRLIAEQETGGQDARVGG